MMKCRFLIWGVPLVLVGAGLIGYDHLKTERLVAQAATFLAGGDLDGAVLMARSAYARDADDDAARDMLMQTYEARQDPRVLELLSHDQLAHTLKAIELGEAMPAKKSYSRLMPGLTVDPESYHEMGVHLFRNEPQLFLRHAMALADLRPGNPEDLLLLAYASLRAGVPYPDAHGAALVEQAFRERSALAADMAALALTFVLTSPVEKPWHRSRIELTAWLQLQIESSPEVRSSFLRALEASRAAGSDAERALTVSLFCLCRNLRTGTETRKVAECLTRMGRGEVLVELFQEFPEAFPEVHPQIPANAFARLLVADAAAEVGAWELVKSVIGEGAIERWGALGFLRHFYEGRMTRERDLGDTSLVNRERELLAQVSVNEAERCATEPWQREILESLAEKYVLRASR